MTEWTARFVTTVTVPDPDTGAPVELEVWKDPASGGLLAVDASFLDQVADRIPNPFNPSETLRLPEPAHAAASSVPKADFPRLATDNDRDEQTYRCRYEIDVDAASPVEAARQAHALMTDPASLPPVLYVWPWRPDGAVAGEPEVIDLSRPQDGLVEPPSA